ncbi:outer membrane lipoprotein carrier protein LolA [Aquabacterium sp.]|uniref:LolA family protein n=1 Tax=Aquabacterium sp. TaxID=1872578 RepID=UPI00378350BA
MRTEFASARRRCLAVVLALMAGSGLAAAAPLQLDELMTLLAQVRSGEARFTEQRIVKGLDAPLLSSGTLSFAAPDRFARRTLEPRPESMVVEGPIVTLTKGGRSRSLVLDASPETEAIVEAVRGTLTGNAQTLKAHFKVAVSGSTDQWALELQPIEPRLQVMLASVRIAGRRAEVRTVEMRMADGDRSVMSIEPLSADKKP